MFMNMHRITSLSQVSMIPSLSQVPMIPSLSQVSMIPSPLTLRSQDFEARKEELKGYHVITYW
jgi:hypothetical protein